MRKAINNAIINQGIFLLTKYLEPSKSLVIQASPLSKIIDLVTMKRGAGRGRLPLPDADLDFVIVLRSLSYSQIFVHYAGIPRDIQRC